MRRESERETTAALSEDHVHAYSWAFSVEACVRTYALASLINGLNLTAHAGRQGVFGSTPRLSSRISHLRNR